mgnify:CR=1 FL=1
MFLNAPDSHILAAVRASFRSAPPPKLGVAVSGGGDSVALLHALTRCFEPGQVELHAATVDHGLRPAAKDEAARVGQLCDALGVPHKVLTWSGWDGSGNLQAEARRARYRLLGDWLRKRGVSALALGHTADQQGWQWQSCGASLHLRFCGLFLLVDTFYLWTYWWLSFRL